MRNLIKIDLKRLLKDKLFLVLCIIGLVLAVVSPLLNKVIFTGLGADEEIMGLLNISGKSLFFGSFSLGNNFGLIAPIFIAIVLFKDFSQGTVRNKVICGKTRTQIFLSAFISSAIVLFSIVLIHALISLALSCALFGYSSTPFTIADLGYLLLSLLFESLVYISISAFITLICTSMKNMGLVIVVYVATAMVLSLLDGIFTVAIAFMESGTLLDIFTFLTKINVFGASYPVGTGTAYAFSDLLYVILTPIFAGSLWVALGLLTFKRKDLK